jgi:5-methyltetrahydropteroyltriglutamate--homocysteine methyltransferase
MSSSLDRILTTHVGSLPRNAVLSDLLMREELDEPIDRELLDAEAATAVAEVVRQQIECGIDVINDGEQPRVGYQTYVPRRMEGFGGASARLVPSDYTRFPEYAGRWAARFPRRSRIRDTPYAVADVQYADLSAAVRECDLFDRATEQHAGRYVDRFMTAASPGIVATTMPNQYYDSHHDYVLALARELRKEYSLVVSRGYVLQLDAPDLAMERSVAFQDEPLSAFQEMVEMHVAAINSAIEGLPRERVRLHCCWGNWEGPHVQDVPLADVLPLITEAKVGALSLEFANPRHQHEYAALERLGLPDEMVLIAGVIDSTTNYVEHPEVVANRIGEAVDAVGDPERVVAGVDCGFGTYAGYEIVAPEIVWEKLKSLAEGAGIATRRFWGPSRT